MSMAMHTNIGIQIDSSDFGLPSRPSVFYPPENDSGEGNSSEYSGIQIDSSDFGLPSRPSVFYPPENDPGEGNSSEYGSSSIGKNSDDVSLDAGECGEKDEVQSSYKGPLDMMDALQEVLPIRKGISSFYDGKSRSYTSLAAASTSSTVKEISKPENAYTRRRRNLLVFLRASASRISKRHLCSISRCGSRSPPPVLLPTLHPHVRGLCLVSPWKLYPVADLRHPRTRVSVRRLEK